MAETASDTPSGWGGVFGFLDGVGGVADRLGGIVDTGADAAEDIARGKAAIADQQLDKDQRELDMALQLAGFDRGDNIQLYWAGAAVAALVLFLLVR